MLYSGGYELLAGRRAGTLLRCVPPFLQRRWYAKWKAPDARFQRLQARFQSFRGRAFRRRGSPSGPVAMPRATRAKRLACRCAVRAGGSSLFCGDAEIQWDLRWSECDRPSLDSFCQEWRPAWTIFRSRSALSQARCRYGVERFPLTSGASEDRRNWEYYRGLRA